MVLETESFVFNACSVRAVYALRAVVLETESLFPKSCFPAIRKFRYNGIQKPVSKNLPRPGGAPAAPVLGTAGGEAAGLDAGQHPRVHTDCSHRACEKRATAKHTILL